MRRRRLFSFALALATAAGGPGAAWAADELDAIATRDRRFAIPVEVAADSTTAEVRLYVSDDDGASWRVHSRLRPPIEKFDFEAPTDKDYLFHVRTVDAAGNESPSGPPTAELRVAVDATPPRLTLTAERQADGTVVTRWSIDDRHVVPQSLKLSYRSPVGGAPQEIVPLRSKRQGDARGASGEVQWRSDVEGDLVVVAETIDGAENRAVIEVAVTAAKPSNPEPLPAGPFVAASSPTAARPTPALPPATLVGTTPLPSTAASTNREPRPAPQFTPAAVTTPLRDPSLPSFVNSTSFELDYDLDRPANDPITKVEVWGTRDAGLNWVLLGVDEDRSSPCAVSVDREGLYGFMIVVNSAAMPGHVPQRGDAPEIRVAVDMQQPKVRLTTAEPDVEGKPCMLKINWEASDEHLGPQAVSMAYAASPQGPWRPLAVGVPNSGGHVCQFDPAGPDIAYLRIEVRDEAGNVGTFATTTPIPIEKRTVQFHFAGSEKSADAKPAPKWFHVLR